ncbi:MAG: hypothetical protein CFE45_39600, partial [Burkholderiales bacterium PBB5]
TLAALMARHRDELVRYHSGAYAERYASILAPVAAHELALNQATGAAGHAADADPAHTPGALPFSRAAATSLFKLMAIKDEYEVARASTWRRRAWHVAARWTAWPNRRARSRWGPG